MHAFLPTAREHDKPLAFKQASNNLRVSFSAKVVFLYNFSLRRISKLREEEGQD